MFDFFIPLFKLLLRAGLVCHTSYLFIGVGALRQVLSLLYQNDVRGVLNSVSFVTRSYAQRRKYEKHRWVSAGAPKIQKPKKYEISDVINIYVFK